MSLMTFLQSNFNEDEFINFISRSFTHFECDALENLQYIEDKCVSSYKFLGQTFLDDEKNIGFFIIHVKPEVNIENIKVALNIQLKKIAQEEMLEGAIAAFYIPKNPKIWRLSFLRFTYDEQNKEEVSNLKRYTYVLGENIPVKTANEQLKLIENVKSLDSLQDMFSVEKISKEFYKGLIAQYENLIKNHLKYPEESENKKEFAIRLLGRILFIKFLNKKSLVGNEVFQVLGNYYHEILEPLFFEQLNTPKNERKEEFKNDKIPFLNGGLFEPLGLDYYRYNGLSSDFLNMLKIDNLFFIDLYEHLNQFNFTIDENSPDDNELSIDPEMLGRIFENLLAELNPESEQNARKATGSYYTPREIVDYMVSSSLLEYLKTKTDISEDILKTIIFKDNEPKTDYDKTKILSALYELKIIDPACGSGAFPMGLLQKIVKILSLIDKDSSIWFNLQNDEFRATHKDRNKDYIRKLAIIKNTIYGVDIQPIAMEISKLRFFLSLIVEEDKEPEPLPNLEFKFVCANSLLSMPKRPVQDNLFYQANYQHLEEKLISLKNEYFDAVGQRKNEIKDEYKKTQNEMFKAEDEINSFSALNNELIDYDPFNPLSQAKFFDSDFMFNIKDGFDIVIGNPPYVRQEKIKDQKPKLKAQNYKSYNGTADLYIYFFEKGYQLLKENGILSFITSNKYTRAKYGQEFRDFVLTHCQICDYLDFNGVKVFENATVDTSILNFKKSNKEKEFFSYTNIDSTYTKNSPLDEFVFKNNICYKTQNLTKDSFIFLNETELSIKRKIESIGTPLKDWDIKINRGILTGYNEAFIINTEKKDEILNNCKTKDERKRTEHIIRPILRGRDIKRYSYEWAGLWLINTHNGYKDNNNIINPIDIKNFPALKEYFDVHITKLTNREDQGVTPYNLRNCAYMSDFDRQKIVYPNMSKHFIAYYDIYNFLVNQKCFIITSKNINLKFLLAFLNSSLNFYYFKQIGAKLGSSGYEMSKIFVEKLPIPKLSQEKELKFIELCDKILELKKADPNADISTLEKKIDFMVYELFNLTDKEIKIVENQ